MLSPTEYNTTSISNMSKLRNGSLGNIGKQSKKNASKKNVL